MILKERIRRILKRTMEAPQDFHYRDVTFNKDVAAALEEMRQEVEEFRALAGTGMIEAKLD